MSLARDGFESYFAEKLWEALPAIYREEDTVSQPLFPSPADLPPPTGKKTGELRAFIEVLAQQAALLRRSHDRLWEDQFIELCRDWAVPYIGELVGTRLVSALNLRGRRIDVAKTIYYRRRKGTPRALEELVSDITAWEGKLVEEFRRLGRMRHGLDPRPSALGGVFTGTPPGGWADLRRPRGAELADGPFDEFHHTPDVRRARGGDGRYGIPKLAFHLYRLASLPLLRVIPGPGLDPQTRTVDPSGRDVPLFMRRDRPDDWNVWRSAREWELPAPMRCRVLGHAEYRIGESLIQQLVSAGLPGAAAADLRTFRGVRFASEDRLRDAVATLANGAAILNASVFEPLLAGALVPDCGKFALVPGSFRAETALGTEVPRERLTAGDLSNWTASAPGKRLVVDPERGRLLFIGAPPAAGLTVSCFYGFSGAIGAGTYDHAGALGAPTVPFIQGGGAVAAAAIDSNGVTQIDDSATYGPLADKSGVQSLVLQAGDRERPYLRLESSWVLDTGANLDSTLVLEGLWIGGAGDFAVVLRGDYERVVVRHSTLDPGGVDALGAPIRPVSLLVEGEVEELVARDSILGPIGTRGAGIVEKLCVCDSIVQSLDAGVTAVGLPASAVELARVTILGDLDVNRLTASEALITGLADVTNTQDGCFRFSAALAGSRVPRPYESLFFADAGPFFTSRRFGQPGYAQLSEAAPVALLRGAENGSEIGAFSGLLNPIKLDGLHAKVDEFSPFGTIPIFIAET